MKCPPLVMFGYDENRNWTAMPLTRDNFLYLRKNAKDGMFRTDWARMCDGFCSMRMSNLPYELYYQKPFLQFSPGSYC